MTIIKFKKQNNITEIPHEKLVDFANNAYPILHDSVLPLIQDFLDFKRKNGSPIEKSVYMDMDIIGFVNRIIAKVNEDNQKPRAYVIQL